MDLSPGKCFAITVTLYPFWSSDIAVWSPMTPELNCRVSTGYGEIFEGQVPDHRNEFVLRGHSEVSEEKNPVQKIG